LRCRLRMQPRPGNAAKKKNRNRQILKTFHLATHNQHFKLSRFRRGQEKLVRSGTSSRLSQR
jgi:hypothetical protein